MAASTYPIILSKTLEFEGGYVNHPKDPGGATNRGVTQATYNRYRNGRGLTQQSVRLISEGEVQGIYRHGYWNAVKGDKLPVGADGATFDAAVNSGPARGIKWLQKALGVTQDGIAGDSETLPAAASYPNKVELVKKICGYRLSFVQSLRTWSTFGKGWARRIASVEALCVRLASSEPSQDLAKGEKEADVRKKNADKGAGTAGAGGAGAGAAGGGEQTGTWDVGGIDPMWLYVVAGLLVIVALAFIARKIVHEARRRAYEEELKRLETGS